MKLGIFGGTFDPVHYGHLILVECCRQELGLDSVRLIPAGQPPHKTPDGMTDGHTRADMLKLAVSGCPDLIVDRREIRRTGKSYTVETLREFKAEFPDDELFFLMGADSIRDLLTWKDPEKILDLATVVGVNRPGVAAPSIKQMSDWIGESMASKIQIVQIPGCDLSATDLRRRVSNGQGLRFMTPKAVEAFIAECRLYLPASK
ncbi:MAG: nicotinate-nucleotide adenylyltransferase [Fuerstiella sp.]